jgi:LemA protein
MPDPAVYALAATGAVIACALCVTYNTLVVLRQRCAQAAADIDVQLKRRRDLIGALVGVVQGHAGHEHGTQQAVAAARRALEIGHRTGTSTGHDAALAGALTQLLVVVEDYPELKAQASFAELFDSLCDTEQRIANARRYLNASAAEHNVALEQFPGIIFAAGFGFTPAAFRDLDTAGNAPAVRFPTAQLPETI